ncbi:lactonase family protein [Chryseolinea sp. T2]|uniref:lactonase family protein n=1 Tax=Chryseolinea sp. T2 TaxID=3129255 RepID=UPI003077EDC3
MRKCIGLLLILLWASTPLLAQKSIIYVGTFSQRGSQGIYVFQFDRAKATLKQLQTVPGLESPTFLTVDKSGRFLYSVNRGRADVNDKGGSVSAYAINAKTGQLSGLNTRSSYGDAPCFISLDRTGKHAFICNYLGANMLVLPVFTDGLLGVPSDSKKYFGSGVNADRQTEPHIHSSYPSPDNRFLYVCDLGTDKVYVYRFDGATGRLSDAEPAFTSVTPGSGPRHLAFHPNGKTAYLVEELTSTVCVFGVNTETGALRVMQDTVRALPSSFTGTNTSADIHFHPNGKFLYMSNRGHNSISMFSVGPDGMIKLIGTQPIDGKTPRNFMIEPKGEFMFVANQDSDTIVLFRIDGKTGKLKPVGKPVSVPAPSCVVHLALASK